jgi:ATP sulfurylase
MRAWTPTVVAPVVLDMVRSGDIDETVRLAGYEHIERAGLPFPGRHRERYIEELTTHVRRWRRRRI